jgi:hypothetical protein
LRVSEIVRGSGYFHLIFFYACETDVIGTLPFLSQALKNGKMKSSPEGAEEGFGRKVSHIRTALPLLK